MGDLIRAARAWNSRLRRVMPRLMGTAEQLSNSNERNLPQVKKLGKMTHSETNTLEGEVAMLMERVRSLRFLLGIDEPAIDKEQEQEKKPRN